VWFDLIGLVSAPLEPHLWLFADSRLADGWFAVDLAAKTVEDPTSMDLVQACNRYFDGTIHHSKQFLNGMPTATADETTYLPVPNQVIKRSMISGLLPPQMNSFPTCTNCETLPLIIGYDL